MKTDVKWPKNGQKRPSPAGIRTHDLWGKQKVENSMPQAFPLSYWGISLDTVKMFSSST